MDCPLLPCAMVCFPYINKSIVLPFSSNQGEILDFKDGHLAKCRNVYLQRIAKHANKIAPCKLIVLTFSDHCSTNFKFLLLLSYRSLLLIPSSHAKSVKASSNSLNTMSLQTLSAEW